MLKNIKDLKNEKSLSYIKEFLKNCTIEEKIDTHYVIIDIISKNEIKIKKSNGNEITHVDLILNSMWGKLILDWNYLKLTNKEWFESHIGYSISMFYFPCNKPLLTEYPDNLRYIFDIVKYNDNVLDTKETLKNIKFPSIYEIGYKHLLLKNKNIDNIINNLDKNNLNFINIFNSIIDENNLFYAINKQAEGIIFKWNKKIYQLLLTEKNRKISSEKTSYEYVLCNFLKHSKTNNYTEKITSGYVKTVCNLFNDFIINSEKITKNIEKNIDINSLIPPTLGQQFDIDYEYISDPVTKNICKSNKLYEYIFKILLANLQKGKDYTHCVYMDKKYVDEWNILVKNIKIHTIYI